MKSRVPVAFAIATLLAGGFVVPASAQHAEYYVLDGNGGVHAGGGAPVIFPAPPYFGFDVAVDITVVPSDGDPADGDGVLVLDSFGGVHVGGTLAVDPPPVDTPYFGFDIARAIVHRNSSVTYGVGVTAAGNMSPSSRGADTVLRLGAGKYSVVFGRDISTCQRVASLGSVDSIARNAYNGEVGEVFTYLTDGTNQGREIIVVTRDGGGSLADRDFFVILLC